MKMRTIPAAAVVVLLLTLTGCGREAREHAAAADRHAADVIRAAGLKDTVRASYRCVDTAAFSSWSLCDFKLAVATDDLGALAKVDAIVPELRTIAREQSAPDAVDIESAEEESFGGRVKLDYHGVRYLTGLQDGAAVARFERVKVPDLVEVTVGSDLLDVELAGAPSFARLCSLTTTWARDFKQVSVQRGFTDKKVPLIGVRDYVRPGPVAYDLTCAAVDETLSSTHERGLHTLALQTHGRGVRPRLYVSADNGRAADEFREAFRGLPEDVQVDVFPR